MSSSFSDARRSRPMAFSRIFSLPPYAIGIVYLVGYVALDWISFIRPFAPFGITPWNPPTGLSFVLILIFGQRYLALLFVAPLLADLVVRQIALPWTVEILAIGIIGAGYALGLAMLVRPDVRFNPALASIRDLVIFIMVAAASAAVVAISYVGMLVAAELLPAAASARAALQFWVGDMIGITVVAPVALILLTRGAWPLWSIETAAQIAAVVIALILVFAYSERDHFQTFYILFLPIVWMAVRGGLENVTVGILVTQLGLILGAQFFMTEIDVTVFQALMIVLALTGLIAGALVTERRRTEFQLRLHQDSLARLSRLGSMGELAAAVAHEINQPLTAAGTYLRLVRESLRSNDSPNGAVGETAAKAALQIERASEVVRRLRALIRLDQSGRAPASVEKIVTETIDLCRPDMDRQGIAVRTAVEPNLPLVMVDFLQIEQVLLNLMRNSIEAMNQAGDNIGTITIAASKTAPGSVEIELRDTGPGFSPEFAIDELPPLSSTKPDGLGIGLSLSRSIIEAHGGRLFLGGGASGAIVRFTLPAVGAPQAS